MWVKAELTIPYQFTNLAALRRKRVWQAFASALTRRGRDMSRPELPRQGPGLTRIESALVWTSLDMRRFLECNWVLVTTASESSENRTRLRTSIDSNTNPCSPSFLCLTVVIILSPDLGDSALCRQCILVGKLESLLYLRSARVNSWHRLIRAAFEPAAPRPLHVITAAILSYRMPLFGHCSF